MRRSVKVIRILTPFVGFAYGGVLALTLGSPTAPFWMIWATIAVAATTAAGLICGYGLGRWYDLSQLCTISVGQVFWWVTALAAGGLVLMNIAVVLPSPMHVNATGGPGGGLGSGLVGMFAIVAAIPVAAVMLGMWRAVGSGAPLGPKDAPVGTRGDEVRQLLALRRLLQGMLAAVGSLVALVTFTAGTWWLLERSLHTEFGSRPRQFVLIFGAFGSTLVGLVYGPAWMALQRRGHQLCDTMFPLHGLDDEAKIVGLVADRQTLEQTLGLNRGFLADLQGGIVILAPLLVGAVAAFLPH